jgi:hypothetical protein
MFNEDNMESIRTLSLARPSIRNDALNEEDSHRGVIEKQSPSFLKHWQKRYFVLERKMLKYFKNEADYMSGKPPKGVLNFQQIWVEVDFKDIQMKIDLKIKGSKRVFNMRCTSQEQFQLWQRKLRYTINSSIGKLKELTI